MKQALFATVPILAVILAFYLNRRAADLRYQLTSPIAIEASDTEPVKSVQQLEVVNIGKASAHAVQVRIQRKVSQVTVVKNSMGDSYKRYDTPTGTEIVYDTLPVEGTIKCIFTVAAKALDNQDIDIKHSEGSATPALASTTTSWAALGYIAYVLVFIFYFWAGAKELIVSSFVSDCLFDPLGLLRKKKPLNIRPGKWEAIRSKAVSYAYRETLEYGDITTWEPYRFLNSDRPTHLSDEEWHELLKTAGKSIDRSISARIFRANAHRSLDDLRRLSELQRPDHFVDEEWERLKEAVSVAYTRTLPERLYSKESLTKALRSKRPDGILEEEWERCIKKLQTLYSATVIGELLNAYSPIESVSRIDLDVLSTSDAAVVKQFAYNREMAQLPDVNSTSGAKKFLDHERPSWMSDKDYDTLQKRAENCLKVENDRDQCAFLSAALQQILRGHSLGDEAPQEAVNEVTRRDLKELDAKIRIASEDNTRRAAELSQREHEADSLAKKVVRQLEIINELLKGDPGVIDRVEDYENVFSLGNMANLRALASLRRHP